MDKPFTLKVQEFENEIVEKINSCQLPKLILKQILNKIYTELDRIEKEEIEKYQESLKKESDK